MKKLFLFLFVASIALYWSSCTKDTSDTPTKYSIENAEKIIEKFNSEASLNEKIAKIYTGKVTLKSTRKEIVVKVENEILQNPLFFVLQTENVFSLDLIIPNAELIYLSRGLIINNLDKEQTLLFGLKNKTLKLELLENIKFDNRYTGYGLVRFLNKELEISDLNSSTSSVYEVFNDSRVGVTCGCCDLSKPSTTTPCQTLANDDCDSGGEGSSSCSLSIGQESCNVQCDAGWTSCCFD